MKLARHSGFTIYFFMSLLTVEASVAQVPGINGPGYMAIEQAIGAAGETREAQIARALAAGPAHVTHFARIEGSDDQGNRVVLREGSNGFICMPGNPQVVGRPASCSNAAAQRWSADLAAGMPAPTNTEAGIIFMQSGATTRNASGETVEIGPQWMIIWPFDPETTGLSATEKDTGAYILWPDTTYAHLHIMGQAVGPSTLHFASEYDGHMPAMGVHDNMVNAVAAADEPAEVQITRALSAGPEHVVAGARIEGTNAQGERVTLREGDNGFACYAGNLSIPEDPPVCRSLSSRPGIWYMLAGATQRSVVTPNDEISPPLSIAPHWMIMMRFDPATSGILEHYSDVGAYLMWSDTRIGHMHINGSP